MSKDEVTFDELAVFFSVSAITIRRDVDELKANNIVDVRNGIITVNPKTKGLIKDRHNRNERRAIQKKAAELIQDRDVIFINTSFTALGILEFVEDKYCTVITNNTHILDLDLGYNITPILTGGEIRQPRSSLSGEFTLEMLRSVNANKCFIGVDAISLEGGSLMGSGGEMYSSVHYEAVVNAAMINNCTGENYVVVTSDRLNRVDRFSCGNLLKVSAIITDNRADTHVINELRARGTKVILV